MTMQTVCDECGKPITGKPLMHVTSTTTPPAHDPVDFDSAACFIAWDAKQPGTTQEIVTGL